MRTRALAAALALACGADEVPPTLPALPPGTAPWSIEDARRAAAVVKQIGAREPLKLPRLDQRASDPAVAQLFALPSRRFIDACTKDNGLEYTLVCMDPVLTLTTAYREAFDREPGLGGELVFLGTSTLETQASLYLEMMQLAEEQRARVARVEAMAPTPGVSEPERLALAERMRETWGRSPAQPSTCACWSIVSSFPCSNGSARTPWQPRRSASWSRA